MKIRKKTKKGIQLFGKDVKLSVDEIEAAISTCNPVECPVVHRFTPGMYIREIFMPAGTSVVSEIHMTEHPYVVSKGSVKVWTEHEGTVLIEAPFTGITKPGTRRVLSTITDTIWTTFHSNPDDGTNVDAIKNRIIEPHINPLITKTERSELCHGQQ
jgi:hypothetical protein